MSKFNLTQAYLKSVLFYNPDTGVFTWIKQNKIAGTIGGVGYIYISLHKTKHLAHRLAWFYMTGEWPKECIDHIDNNKTNNIWSNLREATKQQNARNRRIKNKYGMKGVYWNKNIKRFMVRITINYKMKYIGVYKTLEDASKAYNKAALDSFKDFVSSNND